MPHIYLASVHCRASLRHINDAEACVVKASEPASNRQAHTGGLWSTSWLRIIQQSCQMGLLILCSAFLLIFHLTVHAGAVFIFYMIMAGIAAALILMSMLCCVKRTVSIDQFMNRQRHTTRSPCDALGAAASAATPSALGCAGSLSG
jgi:hypothetical protein